MTMSVADQAVELLELDAAKAERARKSVGKNVQLMKRVRGHLDRLPTHSEIKRQFLDVADAATTIAAMHPSTLKQLEVLGGWTPEDTLHDAIKELATIA